MKGNLGNVCLWNSKQFSTLDNGTVSNVFTRAIMARGVSFLKSVIKLKAHPYS